MMYIVEGSRVQFGRSTLQKLLFSIYHSQLKIEGDKFLAMLFPKSRDTSRLLCEMERVHLKSMLPRRLMGRKGSRIEDPTVIVLLDRIVYPRGPTAYRMIISRGRQLDHLGIRI